MTYAVIKVVNGSFVVDAEGYASVEAAKVRYHGLCETLWNAPDVVTAYVAIVDNQLDVAENNKEYIHH